MMRDAAYPLHPVFLLAYSAGKSASIKDESLAAKRFSKGKYGEAGKKLD